MIECINPFIWRLTIRLKRRHHVHTALQAHMNGAHMDYCEEMYWEVLRSYVLVKFYYYIAIHSVFIVRLSMSTPRMETNYYHGLIMANKNQLFIRADYLWLVSWREIRFIEDSHTGRSKYTPITMILLVLGVQETVPISDSYIRLIENQTVAVIGWKSFAKM